jgi:predicted PurR-regulated permease PerM
MQLPPISHLRPRQSTYWRFWLVTFLILALIVWLLSPILLPFALGLAIAYFFDPVVRAMNRAGLPRWLAALIVLFTFLAIFITAFLFLAPIIREQVTDLIQSLPSYITKLQAELWPRIQDVLKHVPSLNMTALQTQFTQYTNDVVGFTGRMIGQVVLGGMALLDILGLLIITPIIAFFLMRDWPKMLHKIDDYLPLRHAKTIRGELHNIDTMIAGFLRGQAMVSLSLAVIYSIGLSAAGLKYGMVIGLLTGALSFIPIVGTVTGIVASHIMAFIQFDNIAQILPVTAVFAFAQLADGYFLTPRLVGSRVGLHPVWIIFAILAGGRLFGFLGVLMAIPVAGTIAILLRLALRHYRRSRYYSLIPSPDTPVDE